MRRIVTLLAVVAIATLALGALPASAVQQHRVSLKGSAEAHPGDKDASGQFSWTLSGNRLCFLLSVSKFKLPVAAAHIHKGKVNVDGPVFVGLLTAAGSNSAEVARCVAVTAGQRNAIKNHPKQYYVNVHNADFPLGGLRAQLG